MNSQPDPNGITVFFVNGIIRTGNTVYAGWAVADWHYDGDDQAYTYNAFIENKTGLPTYGYIAAHELGHLLGLRHSAKIETKRLMHEQLTGTNGVADTRRLTIEEETTIKTDSHVK